MSQAITRGIQVTVRPEYLSHQSDPKAGFWMFAYHIKIENLGAETVQLLSRHWIITDSSGRVEEVKGAGVVGEQPVLRSGESYDYTSGCPLPTSMGTMHGTYQMVTPRGERFDVVIAPFTLSEPFAVN